MSSKILLTVIALLGMGMFWQSLNGPFGTLGVVITILALFGLGLVVLKEKTAEKMGEKKKKIVGKAIILHESPEKKAEEVEFDATIKSFKHGEITYNVNSDGTFYGFSGFKDRMRKILTALIFYRFGSSDPIAFNEPYPTITAEVLKTMTGESVTGTGMKSLRSAGKPINMKWVLFGIIGIIVAVVLILFLPQLISGIRGAI